MDETIFPLFRSVEETRCIKNHTGSAGRPVGGGAGAGVSYSCFRLGGESELLPCGYSKDREILSSDSAHPRAAEGRRPRGSHSLCEFRRRTIAGADSGGARAVCGGALRGVSALPWSGAGCRGAEVLPALRLRGLDKEESAGVLGEVLLRSLCGDSDDRSFCHDVGCEKSASCFTGEPLECCRPLLVCERGGAGSKGSEGSTGLVRCFSSS